MAMRKVIARELGVELRTIHPNDQYSGDADNLRVHQVLEPLLQKYSLDGTIIEDYRTDEQCEGPTEIVLRGSCVRHVKRLYD
jgi:hypothetical protein